ncbi:hypothetical protein IW261DRAFT_1672250 [Armillaria novae-zelandiae]|uniref:DUF6535 domain-containing protein n=1 Tax=Armillaria novae-zelandiae TaxID=153914 RepID=A0AA39TUV9_9AGAR|nr:hypothetical protein IW261DRAFT_1672250 [Armillaria novae-zelandiae]
MSNEHGVDEVCSRRSSEANSDVQDRPEGSSQNNRSKNLRRCNEEKPEEMENGKENVNSDSIGVEPLLSPGIQEEAGVEGDRDAKKSRPDPGLKTGNDLYNYEDKYPEDKIYEEIAAPNARVWRTFVDESKNHDDRMVGESRDGRRRTPCFYYAQVSASLLFEMVLIQRAIANGSSLDNVPASSLNPSTKFTPATTDVWVNGLWFTSLSLSLATALVAVLVKQWLHHYLALPSGTSQERSLVRQFRYGGFQKWHVLVIVGLLPVLMHLALGIFFVGLTVFLVPLRPGLSWVIGIGIVVAYTTYLISIFFPILYPQCPYRTPLTDLVYFPYRYITQDLIPKHVRPLFVKEVQWHNFTLDEPEARIGSLDDLERRVVQDESATLSVEALHWLFLSSSNPTVHGIVIQSIGGLPLSAMAAVTKVFGEAMHIRRAHDVLLKSCRQYVGGHSFKPWPGMESKVERLLRFQLFIPHLYNDVDSEIKSRPYVEAADDEGLLIAVQSNDTLQRSKYKPPGSPTSTAFFLRVAHSRPVMLPPVIWLGLMRMAKDDGAFNPIDIDSLDVFPMHLCNYIGLWNVQVPKSTSPCLYFEMAAREYFVEEFTANLFKMLSPFDKLADKTSFPTAFTLALASVRYLLHRISLSSFDIDTQHTLVAVLHRLVGHAAFNDPPDDQIAALSDLVEHAVIHSPVFKLEAGWTGPQMSLMEVYSVMYDAPYDDANWFLHPPFDVVCHILGFGLRHGVETVYDVFLETRCLDVFGGHSLRPSLVGVINGYVAGLAIPHASIDSQRHLDYLHEPENLFLACCILATNGWNAFSDIASTIGVPQARLSGDICSDIRALTSLRPLDPSWDQCRRKLRDLLQGVGGDFFVKQQKWTKDGFEVLKPEAIDEAKSNIRLALDELDGFFSDSKDTDVRYSMDPRQSMARRFLGGISQYFQYPRRRERDEVQV